MVEVRLRDVPEQHVVTETRSVDQAALEAWLPGAMARVADAARQSGGLLGAGAWPFLERPGDDPVFVVIYEGNPNEGETPVEVCATVAAGGDRTIPAHREAFVRVTKAQVIEIAKTKLEDLNTHLVESAARSVAGTARSMGIEVID